MIEKAGIDPRYTKRTYSLTPEEEALALKDPKKFVQISGDVENANRAVELKSEPQSFIRPESESDKFAARENYQSSLKSLEIELSALDATKEQIFSDPDEIQISIYGAKIKDAEAQIESLDRICRNKGNSDLDNILDVYKKRFSEYKMIDMEKMKQRLG